MFAGVMSKKLRGGARRAARLIEASLAVAMLASGAHAQTSVNYSTQQIPSSNSGGSGSATSMWGVGSGSGTASQSSLDSATTHDTLGQSAGLVNSAKRGFLYSSGTSIVFEAIGSQSIVNTSIYGDNNIANVEANQTATNSGNVNANGSISLGASASAPGPAQAPSSTKSGATSSNNSNGKGAASSSGDKASAGTLTQAGATTQGDVTVGTYNPALQSASVTIGGASGADSTTGNSGG